MGDGAGAQVPLEIVVIDDEPALAELVARNLAAHGHRVRTAADGRAGLAAIAEQRPDVVVLDVVMPGLDGWGVLESLVEDPATVELPIVMLTALSSEQDVIRAHLTGAVRYLTKPFEVRDLLATVLAAAVPPSDEERVERRRQLRGFLARLAELDAGRSAAGPRVRFSGLEATPVPERPPAAPAAEALTPRQRHVAALLADGVPARTIAEQLGTSRSNIYATRARIARHLGVAPEEVVATARRMGLSVASLQRREGREADVPTTDT
jgi:DNA-binding response OmpR family regulator